jgi:hypothetical protein
VWATARKPFEVWRQAPEGARSNYAKTQSCRTARRSSDPVYSSPLVTKFINGIMWGGKRSIAERTFYTALRQVGKRRRRTFEGF